MRGRDGQSETENSLSSANVCDGQSRAIISGGLVKSERLQGLLFTH